MGSRNGEDTTEEFGAINESVASAIADDYESLEITLEPVKQDAEEEGFPVGSEMVIRALGELIDKGYAHAYILSPQPPHVTEVEFSEERIDDLWFYLTARGKSFFFPAENK